MSSQKIKCLICNGKNNLTNVNGLSFCEKCLTGNKLQKYFEKKIRSKKSWAEQKKELAVAYETCQNVYKYKEKNDAHPFVKYILEDIKDGQSTLDMGCGNGWLSSLLVKKNNVIAVDMSQVMIEECRKKFSAEQQIKFYQSFAEELPIKNNEVNNAVLFDVLEHCVDVDRTLKEINRVLKPGGNLYIVVPQLYGQIYQNLFKNYRKTGRFFQIKRYFIYFLTKKMIGNFHLHEFTRKRIGNLLKKADFQYKFIRFNRVTKTKKILEYLGIDYSHTLFIVATKK